MSYQPNIPQATDLISVSQNDILNNFKAIGTAFDVNHVDFNATGAGKHFKVEMPNQTVDPTPPGGQSTIYSKSGDIWAIRGAGTPYQLTNAVNATPAIFGNAGSTFLPGGLILKWGNRTGVTDQSAIIFSVDSSAFINNCFQVWVSLYNVGNATVANTFVSVVPASVTTTQFIVTCSQRTAQVATPCSFAYLAIGN